VLAFGHPPRAWRFRLIRSRARVYTCLLRSSVVCFRQAWFRQSIHHLQTGEQLRRHSDAELAGPDERVLVLQQARCVAAVPPLARIHLSYFAPTPARLLLPI
jgi:hypothetical protein